MESSWSFGAGGGPPDPAQEISLSESLSNPSAPSMKEDDLSPSLMLDRRRPLAVPLM